ncbi:MAG: hypothetical protein ACJAWL_000955 [Motiliproteus sp.]|jgi:hypothetical protein
MFNKILIANRGDQPRSGAAAQPNRLGLCVAQPGDRHVSTQLEAPGDLHV